MSETRERDPFLPVAGAAGMGFLASVIIENVLRQPQPMPAASVEEIARYYLTRGPAITWSQYFYATAIPCLILFAVGTARRLRALAPAAAPWGQVGLVATTMMTPLFGATLFLDTLLNSNAAQLAANPALTLWFWKLKLAFFAGNVVVLGTGVAAFGVGARLAGMGPRWLATACAVAGPIGIAGSFPMRQVVEGSLIGMLGLVPFTAWVVFLAVTSAGLLRGR